MKKQHCSCQSKAEAKAQLALDQVTRLCATLVANEGLYLSFLDHITSLLQHYFDHDHISHIAANELYNLSDADWNRFSDLFPHAAYFRHVMRQAANVETVYKELLEFRLMLEAREESRWKGSSGPDRS